MWVSTWGVNLDPFQRDYELTERLAGETMPTAFRGGAMIPTSFDDLPLVPLSNAFNPCITLQPASGHIPAGAARQRALQRAR